MTTPMLEKCARAAGLADGVVWTVGYVQHRAADCPEHETTPEKYERLARAVLTALLEPDEGMVEAMLQQAGRHFAYMTTGAMQSCFTAAIQHILKGEGNV